MVLIVLLLFVVLFSNMVTMMKLINSVHVLHYIGSLQLVRRNGKNNKDKRYVRDAQTLRKDTKKAQISTPSDRKRMNRRTRKYSNAKIS